MVQAKAGTGWLVAVVAAMTLLVTTGLWNPFPGLWDWMTRSRPLAEPAVHWQERLGGVPTTVTLLDRFVVVEQRESVEVRQRASGRRVWETKADWAAIAGPPGRTVVVSGTLLKKGYEVRDAATGMVLRKDDKASAVWSFTNAMLDVSCRSSQDCEVQAREPASGDVLWRAGLPGIGFVLFADNPKLGLGATFSPERIELNSQLQPMPPLLAFPIDGRLHLVETSEGRVTAAVEPGKLTSVTVLGGRVVHSIATRSEGTCLIALTGRDGVSGAEVWRRPGYQLRTLSGAGCDQPKEPVSGGNAVLAVRPDGREALLDAGDGREVLTCETGEKVLATNGVYAVVLSADKSKVSAFQLGKAKALWSRKAGADVSAVIGPKTVIISEHTPDRITMLDAVTGRVRTELRSEATVSAFDGTGVLLSDRRELGYVALVD
ncbi:outer membrane protein assembly factor BamB family protein [Catelliglobosispora koreensis]|uniref:outer membrane protein assembly factor BamB family protein n=1 Tax=Catelliglobosispora koreensis TaxID=129052 RepID=UPI00036EACEB|nr:PQQ-binding-like beta-propeller repeat protein [Catelliglobosispora koreensis]